MVSHTRRLLIEAVLQSVGNIWFANIQIRGARIVESFALRDYFIFEGIQVAVNSLEGIDWEKETRWLLDATE